MQLHQNKKLQIKRGKFCLKKENKTETGRGHIEACLPKCPLSAPLPRVSFTSLSIRVAII